MLFYFVISIFSVRIENICFARKGFDTMKGITVGCVFEIDEVQHNGDTVIRIIWAMFLQQVIIIMLQWIYDSISNDYILFIIKIYSSYLSSILEDVTNYDTLFFDFQCFNFSG